MNRSALPRSRRWTAAVVGGSIAGAALIGGGVALADGDPSTDGGSTSTDAPAAPAAGDRLVGTVTAVSEDSLTLTDDAGDSHDVTLTDDTRTGGPAGPGAGGPGAGGPIDGAPAPAADGSTPEAPETPDGETPTPPADSETPTPPAAGEAPTPPAVGEAPADAPAPPTPSADAPAADATSEAIAVGDRVEVLVSDGVATEVHEVLAHVDGLVVSVDGTDLTVVTTPGLRVDVDAAALSDVPAVGDDVHLTGTVTDGTTVVAADGTR